MISKTSQAETLDNTIRTVKILADVIGDLCDNCKQRIRQELKSRGAGRRTIPSQHTTRRPEPGEPITVTEGNCYEVRDK